MPILDDEQILYIAKRAIDKRWDYETMKYSDDMYGSESQADEVWELVEECDSIGRSAFWSKYPDKSHGNNDGS